MANVADVVQLADNSVGVVGALLPHGLHRVYFDRSYLDVLQDFITSTLASQTYQVNDVVSVWPYSGSITNIDGDNFTVEIDRSEYKPGLGVVTWTALQNVPLWRLIRDNDSRIERIWGNEA